VTVWAFRGMKKKNIKQEEIYGEITHKGINTLFEEFKPTKYTMSKTSGVFIDIGCGYGKIVTAYYSMFKKKAFGIDVNRDKINIAKKIHKSRINQWEFIHGDFRNNYEILDKGTYFLATSCMWNYNTMQDLMKYFAKREKPYLLFHNYYKMRTNESIYLDVCWMDKLNKFYKVCNF
tara:strand:- start:1132 stop:1659 length:528 start_codon:yes stop_codon:yes gene_type:complete